MNVAVIGAGVAGLAAAYDLAQAGLKVTLYEAADFAGGLAAGFRDPNWDWSLERFYHHWFQSDHDVLNLIDEIGGRDRVFFPRPITSVWFNGRPHPFDSPLAALVYPGLSWPAKMRFGFVALYLRFSRTWQMLEQHTVEEWATRWMGKEAYRTLWHPMLVSKFGEHHPKVNMAWFWARIYKRSPRLGYFKGGFQSFVDLLVSKVTDLGVRLLLNTPVRAIKSTGTGGITIETGVGATDFTAAVATVGPGLLARLAPSLPGEYLGQLRQLKSMGAQVLILALKHQLMSKTYWLNLPANSPDKEQNPFPFMGLVEHTNYIDRRHYGGDHVVYCGEYLAPDHPHMQLSKDELMALYLPALNQFNPSFKPDWVRASYMFRAPYAQPVPPINHSKNIPDIRTPIDNLYFASMSQVYPWDRGTNYAVEIGRRAAAMLLGSSGRQVAG